MKVLLRSNACVLVSRKSTPYERDGKKGCVNVVGIASEDSVAEMSCTQVAFESVQSMPLYREVFLTCEYDTNYKSCRVVAVDLVDKK